MFKRGILISNHQHPARGLSWVARATGIYNGTTGAAVERINIRSYGNRAKVPLALDIDGKTIYRKMKAYGCKHIGRCWKINDFIPLNLNP